MNKKKLNSCILTRLRNLKEIIFYILEKNNPKITDAEFDKLKIEILELEKDYKFLKNEFSIVNLG